MNYSVIVPFLQSLSSFFTSLIGMMFSGEATIISMLILYLKSSILPRFVIYFIFAGCFLGALLNEIMFYILGLTLSKAQFLNYFFSVEKLRQHSKYKLLKNFILNHDHYILLFIIITRFIPTIRIISMYILGEIRYPPKKVIIFNTIASIIWISVMFPLQYFLIKNINPNTNKLLFYIYLQSGLKSIINLLLLVIVISLSAYFLAKYLSNFFKCQN